MQTIMAILFLAGDANKGNKEKSYLFLIFYFSGFVHFIAISVHILLTLVILHCELLFPLHGNKSFHI